LQVETSVSLGKRGNEVRRGRDIALPRSRRKRLWLLSAGGTFVLCELRNIIVIVIQYTTRLSTPSSGMRVGFGRFKMERRFELGMVEDGKDDNMHECILKMGRMGSVQHDHAAAVAVAPVDATWATSMPAAFEANARFDL